MLLKTMPLKVTNNFFQNFVQNHTHKYYLGYIDKGDYDNSNYQKYNLKKESILHDQSEARTLFSTTIEKIITGYESTYTMYKNNIINQKHLSFSF